MAQTGSDIRGSETPRIFIPARRELTPDTTHGFAAIAFAEEILGLKLFPWQKWLLLHALELNEDGLYRFRTVVVEIARQNGKSLLITVLAMWHIFCLDSKKVIATAQNLARAEESWDLALEWAMSNEELEPLIAGSGDRDREGIKRGHPKRLILDNGCEYRTAASSRRDGRGASGDLILLDELQEHQNWLSWASVTKTTMARPKAQVWAFSNAGDNLSVVMRHLRAKAHRDLGWPDGDADAGLLDEQDDEIAALVGDDVGTGYFEWSAPPTGSRSDPRLWAMANPSLNHTDIVPNCITSRSIAHALHEDPAIVFDTQVLCRWVQHSDGGPFPAESWADTSDTVARIPAAATSVVCLEIPADRTRAYLARASRDGDGKPVVGIWAEEPGTDWVVPYLSRNRDRFATVVIRVGGGVPAASLAHEIDGAGIPFTKWDKTEYAAGCGQMFDLLRDRAIRHLPWPALDTAATSAATKVSPDGGWTVDAASSPTDTAPLVAAIGATWGLHHLPDIRPSIYAGEDGASVLVL